MNNLTPKVSPVLTGKESAVLTTLRNNGESMEIFNNEEWHTVYLDNAYHDAYKTVHNRHTFSGVLASLKEKNLYKPLDGYFGVVKMPTENKA